MYIHGNFTKHDLPQKSSAIIQKIYELQLKILVSNDRTHQGFKLFKGAIRARINTVSKERVKISQQIDAKIM